jgi:putative phosphoesterase
MKIAIISDTHDNTTTLKKAVGLIKKEKIKTIIHCGDIFKPETLKQGLKEYQGKIYIIFSEADAGFSKIPEDSFEDLPKSKVFKKSGQIKIGGKKIAFCHFPEIGRDLAKTQKYDLVFYGHTHKPWEEKIGKTRMVNPGNIAGLFFRPSFAIYDTKTDKLELKILNQCIP